METDSNKLQITACDFFVQISNYEWEIFMGSTIGRSGDRPVFIFSVMFTVRNALSCDMSRVTVCAPQVGTQHVASLGCDVRCT